MILVTGATGKIGPEVVARLSAKGAPVRAFVRDPAKAGRLLGPQVALAQGDLDDAAAVERALQGVDTLFLLTAANPKQELALLDQAVRSGVKRVVKLSSMGASPDSPISLARGHAEVEARLRAAPVSWTILRPGMFAQNLLMNADTIRGEGRFVGAFGEGKVAPIDVRDIADVAVAALTEDGHAGQTYTLTGPTPLTYADLASALSAATGKPVSYVDVPLDAIRDNLQKAVAAGHLPAFLADDLVKMQGNIARGGVAQVTDDVSRVLGRPARPFSDFARDSAAAFGG
jgi:uncharacterized protein YbjT (DUF2867 family)